jgi:hypothetical protein
MKKLVIASGSQIVAVLERDDFLFEFYKRVILNLSGVATLPVMEFACQTADALKKPGSGKDVFTFATLRASSELREVVFDYLAFDDFRIAVTAVRGNVDFAGRRHKLARALRRVEGRLTADLWLVGVVADGLISVVKVFAL